LKIFQDTAHEESEVLQHCFEEKLLCKMVYTLGILVTQTVSTHARNLLTEQKYPNQILAILLDYNLTFLTIELFRQSACYQDDFIETLLHIASFFTSIVEKIATMSIDDSMAQIVCLPYFILMFSSNPVLITQEYCCIVWKAHCGNGSSITINKWSKQSIWMRDQQWMREQQKST
jgi:CDP-diglyceride synthetase